MLFSKYAIAFIRDFLSYDHSVRHQLKKYATKEAVDFYHENMSGAQIFKNKKTMLDYELLFCNTDGLYLEFGVHQAVHTNYIANKIKPKTIHGFDSFRGFPEYYDGTTTKAHDINGIPPKVKTNVNLHIGWFNTSIPKFAKENNEKITYLNIDCDLYSSTKTVFDCIGDMIQKGTIIHFDEFLNFPDWRNHEFKAWNEFIDGGKIEFEYLAIGNRGEVAIKVTNIK